MTHCCSTEINIIYTPPNTQHTQLKSTSCSRTSSSLESFLSRACKRSSGRSKDWIVMFNFMVKTTVVTPTEHFMQIGMPGAEPMGRKKQVQRTGLESEHFCYMSYSQVGNFTDCISNGVGKVFQLVNAVFLSRHFVS